MTLKEELSLSHKTALAEQEKLDIKSDEEIRKMISQYIEPMFRKMHKQNPLEKSLSIRVSIYGNNIWLAPICNIVFTETFLTQLDPEQLLKSADRVAQEFGIEIQKEMWGNYIFTLNLED